MNNEVLKIPGKINADMREVIKVINKKEEHGFSIWLYDNTLHNPCISNSESERLMKTMTQTGP